MPLMKGVGKKAFDHNVKAEIHAGKPQPQAIAIAYSAKRQTQKKGYAHGGKIMQHAPKGFEERYYEKAGQEHMAPMYPKGGIADAILKKKRMANGGMATADNDEETPAGNSPYDDDNYDAIMKEIYDEDQLSDQPEDSNQHGHELSDEDERGMDMIEAIRRRMKKGK